MNFEINRGQSHNSVMRRSVLLAPLAVLAAIACLCISAMSISAEASTSVVRPGSEQGWITKDVRGTGTLGFVADSQAPLGDGAVQIRTVVDGDKYQYMHPTNIKLSDARTLAYYTKQLAASSQGGSISFQLEIDTNGVEADVAGIDGFTTLVYEPYWQNAGNPDAAPVVAGEWQQWDVDQGLFWSSKTLSEANLVSGAGGPPFYTLTQVLADSPQATVTAFGINAGTYNPAYIINADALTFNEVTYDFEALPLSAFNPDDCKNNGYLNYQTPYKNQGQCVAAAVSNSINHSN